MRQDKRFKYGGEAITSKYFAKLLSNYFDGLITVEPHLHHYKSLNDIYNIPAKILSAQNYIASWIKCNIQTPVVVIGPDNGSEQLVSNIAKIVNAPYLVLEKTRTGEHNVKVECSNESKKLGKYSVTHTPVLVDDIISTACTMIEAVKIIKRSFKKQPFCIGIHAVFAGDAYRALQNAGVKKEHIITCNTIIK